MVLCRNFTRPDGSRTMSINPSRPQRQSCCRVMPASGQRSTTCRADISGSIRLKSDVSFIALVCVSSNVYASVTCILTFHSLR